MIPGYSFFILGINMTELLRKACYMVLGDANANELHDMREDLGDTPLPSRAKAKELLWGELTKIALECSYPKLYEILQDNKDIGLYQYIQDCTISRVRYWFVQTFIDRKTDFLESCKPRVTSMRTKRKIRPISPYEGCGPCVLCGSTVRSLFLEEVIKAAKALGIKNGHIRRFKEWARWN